MANDFDFFRDVVFAPVNAVTSALDPKSYYTDADQVSEEQMAALVEHAKREGLTAEQINRLFEEGSNLGASATAIAQMINNMRYENTVAAEADTVQAAQDEYINEAVGAIETEQGRVQGDIDRFTNLTKVPGAIRNDEEYGAMLAEAEAYVNAQQQNTQRQAANSTAQSGLRSSGRAADTALRAQETAAAQKAGVSSGIRKNILDRLDTAETNLGSLGVQKAGVKRSNVDTGFDVANLRLGGYADYDPMEDILGVQTSQESAQRGSVDNIYGTLLGTATGAADTAANFTTNLIGNMRKG